VQIAFVALDASNLPESKRPGDDQTRAYLDANREVLQATYDADLLRFNTPEQVELRHILFKPNSSDGEEAAAENRERAEAALARLSAGEDFAAVAEEVSNDTSSNQNGGKLGTVGRGDLTAELDAVVFDLVVGANSEIIEGPEGLHIVRVDSKTEASKESFDTAGLTLAGEGATAEAAAQLASDLAAAVAGGQSLEGAARAAELTLERTSFFTRRRDGFVPGLSRPSTEVISAAFTLDMDAPSSPTVFDVGEQKVLIQLLDRQEPDATTLATTVASTKQSLEAQRQNTLIQAWIDDRREEFESQGRLQINTALLVSSGS
jgi:peptidyl-prolyl cis-trans isomerase D